MRRLLIVAAILASGAAHADGPAPLKPGPGSDLTAAVCNICHTSNYIIMNSMFMLPAQWAAEVTKMRTVFGAPLDDGTQAAITAYLGANYAVPPKP
jgi:hypothetical protein